MRKLLTAAGTLLASLLLAVILVVATVGSMVAGPDVLESRPTSRGNASYNGDQPDTGEMPSLQGGGPAGPIVFTPARTKAVPEGPLADIVIDAWYGSPQKFGQNGNAQKWANILGNVTGPNAITSLTYKLNGGPSMPVGEIGPNGKRLAETGDFNIEIDYTDLNQGNNSVEITAADGILPNAVETVTINYDGTNTWSPGTKEFDWSSAAKIQDIAQMVDGQWVIDGDYVTPDGVYDFDRLIALGDLSWKDYTVTIPISITAITGNGEPGIGFGVRWQGHYKTDGNLPRRGWREQLGGLGWYRWKNTAAFGMNASDYVGGFQLIGSGQELDSNGDPITMPGNYIFKLQVSSNASGPANYRFKYWEQGQTEPVSWTFDEKGKAGEAQSGGVLLVAHHINAAFGKVTVDLDSTLPKPELTTTKTGTGSGTVSAAPNKTTFKFGEVVELSAAADTGSQFTKWTGDIGDSEKPVPGDTENPIALTMFGDRDVNAVFTDPSNVTPVSDDFSACQLDTSLWQFINPLGDASYDMIGTHLQINVPGGTDHDIWEDGLNAPRIMQGMNDNDFGIEVKLDTAFDTKTQMMGVLIEEDDKEFIRFNVQHNGNGYKLLAYSFTNGKATERYKKTVSGGPPYYLRVTRSGDDWKLEYSTNGSDYTTAADFTFAMNVTAAGPFAGNQNKNPAYSAQFDYFFDTANPIDPQDGPHSLTVSKVGNGSVTKTPDEPHYNCDEVVNLEAVADEGWVFSAWSGAASGTDPLTSVTMNKAEEVTATFIPAAKYAITVDINGSGSVTRTPDQAEYSALTPVELNAVPAAGHGFVGWSGDLIGKDDPDTIIMDSDKVIMATFSPNVHSLTILKEGQGTVTKSADKLLYANGEQVILTAQGTGGEIFSGWSGDYTGTDNPAKVVMTKDMTITAKFVPGADLTVTTHVVGQGSVTKNPDQTIYKWGDFVELTAVPAANHAFVGWSGDLTGTTNPESFTMTQNVVVTATFGLDNQYSLTADAVGNGTVTKTPDKPLYAVGEKVEVKANPDQGYRFSSWSGDLLGTVNPTIITMDSNKVVTGTFVVAEPVSFTWAPKPEAAHPGGSVVVDPGVGPYYVGNLITATATVKTGYRFSGWTVNGSYESNANDLVYTLPDLGSPPPPPPPINLVATFTDQLGPLVDYFNSCTVDPMWTWTDPLQKASYRSSGQQMVLSVPAGVDYGLIPINPANPADPNNAARLMQSIPNTDFELYVKFDSKLDKENQQQGVLIQTGTPGEYLRFSYDFDGQLKVVMATFIGGQKGRTIAKIADFTSPPDSYHLRVRRQGDKFKLWYADDGESWNTVGQFKYPAQVTGAGLFAASFAKNPIMAPGILSAVDYFSMTQLPVQPEAGAGIDITILGQGSVTATPDKTEYICGEQVTLAAFPNSGWRFDSWSGDVNGTLAVKSVEINGRMDVTALFVPGQGTLPYAVFMPVSVGP